MVLEARYKAEEVWYSLVWEEQKEASNVVDYNINEEITKDASATENANNQTTTGMATVVPWINAPKLLAKTSIIWDSWWKNVVEISDYLSVDEWQPVADRVWAGEFVIVRTKFVAWSNYQYYYFIPFVDVNWTLRFHAIRPWFHWFMINLRYTWTTITSITTSDWDW